MRILAAGILLVGISAQALMPDLPAELQQRSLPVYREVNALFSSPDVMAYRDTLSLSHVQADAMSLSMPRPLIPQDGGGREAAALGGETYLHLDSGQTVWGSASFSVGRIKDISMCNSLDYELLAPYVTGDYAGGDLTCREYEFEGGYNIKLAPRWSLGAQVAYRAEIAWRDVDPRVRTIVSDLDLGLGVSYRYSSSRILGIAANARVYSQNCDLEFYKPTNDINTLPFTGLGTYYKRFAGNTNKNSAHTGMGVNVAARWLSTDRSGFQLLAHFGYMRINQMLRNFNNLPLAYTDTYRINATLCYGIKAAAGVKLLPLIDIDASRRNGHENLFGTAAGASYDKIGSRKPYESKHLGASARVPMELHFAHGYLTVTPAVYYLYSSESHVYVPRSITDSDTFGKCDISYSHLSGVWLWSVSAGSSTNARCINGATSLQRLFGKIMAGISFDYRHNDYGDGIRANQYDASLTLTF